MHTLLAMSSRFRRAGVLSVLVLLLVFALPAYAQDAEKQEKQSVDPAMMKAAVPLVVEGFLLTRLKRNTTSHMGVEGEYFRVDKLMALLAGRLEGSPSDHQAFRMRIGFGPMSDGQAQSIREAGIPSVTVDGLPEAAEVYDDESGRRSALLDASMEKTMIVQGGASSARIALITSVSSTLAGEATDEAATSVDTGAVRRVQNVYNAFPARAGQHELIEYEVAESKELAESNQLAFSVVYAKPDQPRGTRIRGGFVLLGGTRMNQFLQQVDELGDELRRDTTLAGRDAVVVGTGTTGNGVVTRSNDRAIVLFPFDGYQIMVVAADRDVSEEDVIALASALDLSSLEGE